MERDVLQKNESLPKRVWYGIGTAIESQSPEAWGRRISRIVEEKIVPKLPRQWQTWAEDHREEIREAATYAGVGITTAEVVAAVSLGVMTKRRLERLICNLQIRHVRAHTQWLRLNPGEPLMPVVVGLDLPSNRYSPKLRETASVSLAEEDFRRTQQRQFIQFVRQLWKERYPKKVDHRMRIQFTATMKELYQLADEPGFQILFRRAMQEPVVKGELANKYMRALMDQAYMRAGRKYGWIMDRKRSRLVRERLIKKFPDINNVLQIHMMRHKPKAMQERGIILYQDPIQRKELYKLARSFQRNQQICPIAPRDVRIDVMSPGQALYSGSPDFMPQVVYDNRGKVVEVLSDITWEGLQQLNTDNYRREWSPDWRENQGSDSGISSQESMTANITRDIRRKRRRKRRRKDGSPLVDRVRQAAYMAVENKVPPQPSVEELRRQAKSDAHKRWKMGMVAARNAKRQRRIDEMNQNIARKQIEIEARQQEAALHDSRHEHRLELRQMYEEADELSKDNARAVTLAVDHDRRAVALGGTLDPELARRQPDLTAAIAGKARSLGTNETSSARQLAQILEFVVQARSEPETMRLVTELSDAQKQGDTHRTTIIASQLLDHTYRQNPLYGRREGVGTRIHTMFPTLAAFWVQRLGLVGMQYLLRK